MSHLADGWHDLPSGGSVEVKDGIPVRVTDKGHDSLDEKTILSEAAEYSEMNLEWHIHGRSKRWYQHGLTKEIFDALCHAPMRRTWSFAPVLVQACSNCGVVAGVRWIDRPPEPTQEWVCDACAKVIAKEVEELSKDRYDKDPYKG